MRHRIAAVAAVALLAAACGGADVTGGEARAIVVDGLLSAGYAPAVATCAADAALAEHSAGELANASGTTSEAVNASVAAIIADCTARLAPPTSPPTTTTPVTSPPTTEAIGPFTVAACTASHATVVVVDAARAIDEPGPAAFEAWVREAQQRAERAALVAPRGELGDLQEALQTAVDEFAALAAANEYTASISEDGAADELVDEINELTGEIRTLLRAGCPAIDVDDRTAAEALAAELTALDEPPPTTAPPTTVQLPDVPVHHAASGIRVDVPGAWTGETGGVADTRFGPDTRFLVRAPDPAVFAEGRFDGTGVSIHARDDTIDFLGMLAATATAQGCTFASETAYDDGVYVGIRREYTRCGTTPVTIVVVAAVDDHARVATVVEVRAAAPGDRAIDLVLNSFYV